MASEKEAGKDEVSLSTPPKLSDCEAKTTANKDDSGGVARTNEFSGDSSSSNNATSSADRPEVDQDLMNLLDNAALSFGKAVPAASSNSASSSMNIGSEQADDSIDDALLFDQNAAKQAASEFQNMLRQLAQVQEVAMNQTAMGGADSGMGAEGDNLLDALEPQDRACAQEFVKNLQVLADKAQSVTEAESDDTFAQAMHDLHTVDGPYENDLLPFMQGLMGSLLSKDMMYPSMSDMRDKYPKWLEENESKVSEADFKRFKKQQELVSAICEEYEEETENETEEVRNPRFDRLVHLMQQMQTCGQPPEELVGSLPPGWGMDEATGLPHVMDTQTAAENCCVM